MLNWYWILEFLEVHAIDAEAESFWVPSLEFVEDLMDVVVLEGTVVLLKSGSVLDVSKQLRFPSLDLSGRHDVLPA